MNARTLFSCVTLPLILIGCGGSGDGGVDPRIPMDPVSISSSNASGVATESLTADELATGAALGVQVEDITAQTVLSVANDFAARYLKDRQAPTTPVGVTESGSYQCTGGGSVAVTGTATGFEPNGNYVGPPVSISLQMTFNSCVESGATLIGDLNFSIEEDLNYDLTVAIHGSSLQVLAPPEYGALLNYRFAFTMPFDSGGTPDGNVTYDFDYVVASTSIGGLVTVETDVPYEIDIGTGYPLAGGHTYIYGANGASLSLEALGNENISLELDADGDNLYEEILPIYTWGELAAADWSDPGFAALW